ncbi:polymorphic toxin-type HINT domain-containing protein [Solwaraspora sp. WMMD1047]|uniref:polymorphic toxin-type HINT domain-containing protein n=1 Tax=Solwaraspora sp. WMMD1047 TaxID=3016102 RepID=UPI0024170663|nr:polymorphic toxin-type HINT domain-containing protein [Solwaraspora sp. WMMD1047]MDG4828511.1 polymorphic toxin-type HINT domain-containing protein [Solwaraspora sp. WMMD1047]
MDWDIEGRPAEIAEEIEGGETVTNVYDVDGNRLIRRDATGATLYLPGMEVRRDGHGSDATLTATRHYSFGGRVVASRVAGIYGVSWIFGDHQGTERVSVNSSTQQVAVRRQTPYGSPRGTQPVWPTPKGFVGGAIEPTGLTHIGARQYDPGLGRFISVDPIMDLSDPQQWHAYAYANNNPITFSDPTGLVVTGDNEGKHTARKKKKGRGYDIRDERLSYWPKARNIAAADRAIAAGEVSNPLELAKKAFLATFTPDSYACQAYAAGNCELLRDQVSNGSMHPDDATIWALCGGDSHCYERYYSDGGDIETFLTLMGFVPGVGEVADLMSMGIALYNEDYEGAALSAAAMVPLVGNAAGARRLAGLSRACSFSADTPVLMADGSTKPIGELAVGDVVLAADPETGERGPRQITHVWVHQDDLVNLDLANGSSVTTTEDHPFWNATDRQWQQAQHLTPGDHLLTSNGTRLAVAGIDWNTTERAAAYNLTVTDIHTYYVLAGNTPVLVHNSNCPKGKLSDPLPRGMNNKIASAYDDVKAGRIASHDTYRGREHPWWAGAKEYRVPGRPDSDRILEKTLPGGEKVYGWTSTHYQKIQRFSAPHFPDSGWN